MESLGCRTKNRIRVTSMTWNGSCCAHRCRGLRSRRRTGSAPARARGSNSAGPTRAAAGGTLAEQLWAYAAHQGLRLGVVR